MTSIFKMELVVRTYLNENVLQRWIARKSARDLALCAWNARFPDLTVCDFLVEYIKDKVYTPPLPANIDDMKH